jgi:hypothetical protein
VPSQWAARVQNLLCVISKLQDVVPCIPDLLPDAWEVLLLHSQPQEDSSPGSAEAPDAARRAVQVYAEYLRDAVARDVQGRGVMYAPQTRRFTCVQGGDAWLQQTASCAELTALLQVSRQVYCTAAGYSSDPPCTATVL